MQKSKLLWSNIEMTSSSSIFAITLTSLGVAKQEGGGGKELQHEKWVFFTYKLFTASFPPHFAPLFPLGKENPQG